MRSANNLRRCLAALAMDMRISRHERRVEGALGENRPEVIGQPQSHEERVRHRTGAENRGEHDVARKSGQPRKKRKAADGEDTSEHQPLLQHAAALQNGEIRRYRLRMIFSRKATPSDQSKGALGDHALTAPRTALMIRSCVGSSR